MFRWFKKIYNKILLEIRYRKKMKELKKKEREMVKKDGLEFDKLFGLNDEVTE